MGSFSKMCKIEDPETKYELYGSNDLSLVMRSCLCTLFQCSGLCLFRVACFGIADLIWRSAGYYSAFANLVTLFFAQFICLIFSLRVCVCVFVVCKAITHLLWTRSSSLVM